MLLTSENAIEFFNQVKQDYYAGKMSENMFKYYMTAGIKYLLSQQKEVV